MAGNRAPSLRNLTAVVAAGAMLLLGLMAILVTYSTGDEDMANNTGIVKGTTLTETASSGVTQSPAIATVLAYFPDTTMISGSDRSSARRDSIQLKQEDQALERPADVRLGLARHDRVTPGGRYLVSIVAADATDR